MRHPTLSPGQAEAAPDSDVEDGNLDNYIYFVRRRLKAVGSRLKLRTIRGIGYCLLEE